MRASRGFSFRGLSGEVRRLSFDAYGFIASMELLSGRLAEASTLFLQKFLRGCGVLLLLENPTLFGLLGSPTSLLQQGFVMGSSGVGNKPLTPDEFSLGLSLRDGY